ncbi:mitochondrial 54S ribosomal protein bL9m MRPL50 [Kluyveromyces lactis]|uniref:KLLA0C09064p n=1 Tax=Kluyveromyces lactis (strain ATCC 8585 / CBS 2359 / DSM 70799 / NBRC 1267 / NRRL Y-1140 / WM37) TaxID=284590 RepID=Q6CTY6_KLULA|nr:uncharacterized protein KLLA0_C09064g [Kluyveromyces lactis]CAH01454.1 KLLA0C09064p [Kluyveromyces lactis]|eukprot:XP_452603.1 uncharacterized protein KLLA0_C09064g [Kluyveromyces lactis]
MFRPTSSCLSALTKRTKRVQVQLLKDFPQFQFHTGEVVNVKPSLMRNFLHNYNGARYILKETDIDQALLTSAKRSRASAAALLKTTESTVKKTEQNVKKAKQVSKEENKTPETPKSALNEEITIENVKIPGLDL